MAGPDNNPRSLTTEGLPPHEVARVFPPFTKDSKLHSFLSRRGPTPAASSDVSNSVATSAFTSGSSPTSTSTTTTTCGCLVPLSVAIDSMSCPRCDAPLGSVCDGLALTAFGWGLDVGHKSSEHDNNASDNGDDIQGRIPPSPSAGLDLKHDPVPPCRPPLRVVIVKFGPRILSLGLPPPPSKDRTPRGTATAAATTTTAQARIAHVLGLDMSEMKILAKGKVLYPSSTGTDEQISDQLLDLSATLWTSPMQQQPPQPLPLPNKASLLVLGTRRTGEIPRPGATTSYHRWWAHWMSRQFGWVWSVGIALANVGARLFARSVAALPTLVGRAAAASVQTLVLLWPGGPTPPRPPPPTLPPARSSSKDDVRRRRRPRRAVP